MEEVQLARIKKKKEVLGSSLETVSMGIFERPFITCRRENRDTSLGSPSGVFFLALDFTFVAAGTFVCSEVVLGAPSLPGGWDWPLLSHRV